MEQQDSEHRPEGDEDKRTESSPGESSVTGKVSGRGPGTDGEADGERGPVDEAGAADAEPESVPADVSYTGRVSGRASDPGGARGDEEVPHSEMAENVPGAPFESGPSGGGDERAAAGSDSQARGVDTNERAPGEDVAVGAHGDDGTLGEGARRDPGGADAPRGVSGGDAGLNAASGDAGRDSDGEFSGQVPTGEDETSEQPLPGDSPRERAIPEVVGAAPPNAAADLGGDTPAAQTSPAGEPEPVDGTGGSGAVDAERASAPLLPLAPTTAARTGAAGPRHAAPRSANAGSGRGGPGRGGLRRPLWQRAGRETVGIAVLVVLALVCAGLAVAVVQKTQAEAAQAAREAANYTPPPLATPTPAATGPAVAIIGDGGASLAAAGVTAAQRWPALLQSAISGTVTTTASEGMGYAATDASGQTFVRSTASVPASAGVVVLFGGTADTAVAAPSLDRAVRDAIAAVQRRASAAKVVVVGPVLSGGLSIADLMALRTTLETAAKGTTGVTWVDPIADRWLPASSRDAASAGSLTAADERAIATRMQTVVRAATR